MKWEQYTYSMKVFYLPKLPNMYICKSFMVTECRSNNSLMDLFVSVSAFYLQKLTFYYTNLPDKRPLWLGNRLFWGYLLCHDTCPGDHVTTQLHLSHWHVPQVISVQWERPPPHTHPWGLCRCVKKLREHKGSVNTKLAAKAKLITENETGKW